MSAAHLYAMADDGRWVPVRSDAVGELAGGTGGGAGQIPSSQPTIVQPWTYAAVSGGIQDTADDVVIAAAGAGMANYMTDCQVINTHASVATEVVIKSGSTVRWRFKLRPGDGVAHTFSRPLISGNNEAFNVAAVTTGAEVYFNAQGYREAAIEIIQAEQTSDLELFDGFGNQMVDGSGNLLTVPHY